MSTLTTNGVKEAARPAAKPARARHTPGGAALGQDAGHEAQRLAAAILDVLAGTRTPAAAAEALGVSQARYFQVEARAMQALVDSCKPRPRGPGRNADKELAGLQRQLQRLQQEVNRQQTLLRLAQRTIGLPSPKAKAGVSTPGAKRKRTRRPVVRALRAAEALHRRSQETGAAPASSSAAATPAGPGPG
jgi:hypothetical protein